MASTENRIEAFTLAQRAIAIELGDVQGELADAEACLLRAIELDPVSIEALQEAAHFFDAVTPRADQAREFATRCREQAAKVVAEMDEILQQE